MRSKLDKKAVAAWLTALKPEVISALVVELEEDWGIEEPYRGEGVTLTGVSGVTMGMPLEETFDVVLVAVGVQRIEVMKALRRRLGVGLPETLALVNGAPVTILETALREEAAELRWLLEGLGAQVRVQ